MLKRFKGAAIAVSALVLTSGVLSAAGLYSTLPIVEGSSYCASTVTGTGNLGGVTGQGQGSIGSICAQTVPAGPAAVTGYESIPADTGNGINGQNLATNGGGPGTVVLQMANLNALPLTVSTVVSSAITPLTATNVTGGIILHSTGTISQVSITLPATPLDGQQFAVSSDQTVTGLSILTASSATAGQTVTKSPTALTSSTTAAYGYRFMYNAAGNNWYRLQ